MGILEIIAEERLGKSVLAHHSELKSRLQKIEEMTETRSASQTSDEDKQRIAAIVELCFEYDREKDPEERENILRTLTEIAGNEPVELPSETIEQWDNRVAVRPYVCDIEAQRWMAHSRVPEEILFSPGASWAEDPSRC